VEHSNGYIIGFAAAVCGVCAIIVSTTAVQLKPMVERNERLAIQEQVLALAGVAEEGVLSDDDIEAAYQTRIEPRIIELDSGLPAEGVDPAGWDQQARMADPSTSVVAPDNPARVRRLPNQSVVYFVKGESGEQDKVILPIQGQGLWGTLYGYLAVASDGQTIDGLTFYKHKETPGLGGEVDNPRWKALWPGRKIYSPDGDVAIQVVKGSAGPVAEAPYDVDGLSGATITSRGVTNTLAFWLGPEAFGPYLERIGTSGGGS
jgi:Na+-transporting NADH:ubiquinone oxidoreductase subunit C